jgi:hypothetical protein
MSMVSYPDSSEFIDLLRARPLCDLVRDYLFTGIPYVFRRAPQAYDVLRGHLSSSLGIAKDRILVVGSARTGFSLDPNNFPRRFGSASDIDVIVIDDGQFDAIWQSLLKWHYPRKEDFLPQPEHHWLCKRKDDIFFGWMCPDKFNYKGFQFPSELKTVRDISNRWFGSFHSFGFELRYPDLARREVRGRLYRTMEHAMLYHVQGLIRLKARLTVGSGSA